MKNWSIAGRILIAAVGLSALAVAQGPRGGFGRGGFGPGPLGPGLPFAAPGQRRPVTGEPFTASATLTTNRVNKDGQTVTRQITMQLARDTDGRTYIAATLPAPAKATDNGGAPREVIYIHDPVAHLDYTIYPARSLAVERKLPPPPPNGAPRRDPGGRGHHPNLTTTSLGTEQIAGVTATGTQRSFTRPAPPQASNQQPETVTSTVWYSDALHLVLSSGEQGPRGGSTTYVVQSLQQSAPDASLFTVPSGDTVRTMRGRGGWGGAPLR